MSAAPTRQRCDVCRAMQPPQELESAVMREGFGWVCRDGFECAERSNGKPARPALRLVQLSEG